MIVDERIRTSSVGEAEEAIGRIYRRSRIEADGDPFVFALDVSGDDQANIARFRLGARAEVVSDLDGVLAVGAVRRGEFRATSNGVEVDASAPFLLHAGEARSRSSGVDLTVVNLDLAALGRHAGRPLHLVGTAPRPGPHVHHWHRTLVYAEQVFGEPGLLRNELIRLAAVDALMVAALSAFPLTGDDSPASGSAVLSGPVRRARRFMDDNAALPIDTVDVAAAARLSPRGLQSAFQRELGTTPMRYLRTVRLDAVRAELIAATSGETAVADIARRWGFAHLGRFAQAYRDQFGELPGATLRR